MYCLSQFVKVSVNNSTGVINVTYKFRVISVNVRARTTSFPTEPLQLFYGIHVHYIGTLSMRMCFIPEKSDDVVVFSI